MQIWYYRLIRSQIQAHYESPTFLMVTFLLLVVAQLRTYLASAVLNQCHRSNSACVEVKRSQLILPFYGVPFLDLLLHLLDLRKRDILLSFCPLSSRFAF